MKYAQRAGAAICAAAGGYAIYASITQSGLAGYVIQLQMDVLGSSEEGITFLLTFVLLMLALLLLYGLGEKFGVWDRWSYPGDSHDSRPAGDGRLTWRTIFVVCAFPFVGGPVVVGACYFADRSDQRQTVYQVDLTSGETHPRGAKFVTVTGRMARSYALLYKRTDGSGDMVRHEIFAPVTEIGWTPVNPVRYFVRHEVGEGANYEPNWPDVFRVPGVTQFSGKITRPLPAFVQSRFQAKGVKLASEYSVIEWQEFPDHKVPSSFPYAEELLFVGPGFAVFLFLTIGILKAARG